MHASPGSRIRRVARVAVGLAALLAPVESGAAAAVGVRPPVSVLSALAPAPAWSFEPDLANASAGSVVTLAGDVNGDGFSDVLVAAPRFSAGQSSEGRVSVFHGSASGLSPLPAWTAESNADDVNFGSSAAPAGDVNGDGYADVIVGAWRWTNGEHEEGKAWVYLGSSAGLQNAAAWSVESDQADAWFGIAVASAGDVDGDGFGDVIVGASNAGARPTGEGAAYVFRGSAGGPEAAPSWTLTNAQVGSRFGEAVCTAGDVNGDGFSDVIVGARYGTNGETQEGIAYVYHGSANGLSLAPAWTTEANQLQAFLGTSVSTAGDVNGDGYSDVIVGANQSDNGFFDNGRALVYHGGPGGLGANPSWFHDGTSHAAFYGSSVSAAGDVNDDGYADVIVGGFRHLNFTGIAQVFLGSPAGLAAVPDWETLGGPDATQYGFSVGTAGDVNGDGHAEVVVGAPWTTDPEVREGAAYLYLGVPAGISPDPNASISHALNGVFSTSVGTAGDVNGDGFSDLLLSEVPSIGTRGRVEVHHGSPAGFSPEPDWTVEGTFDGQGLGNAVATAGDVNGDGYGDLLVSQMRSLPGELDAVVSLFHGSASGLAADPAWTGTFESAFDDMRFSSAGDVNGDGYGDVLVSDIDYGDDQRGAVYLWFGSASGLGDPCAPCAPTDADWFVAGRDSAEELGRSLSGAGDVNGDGYSDVLIGREYPFASDNGGPGRFRVYMGSATGLDTLSSWTADGVRDSFSLIPPAAGAGDVNGDGFADVFTRAFLDPVGARHRRFLVWYGSAQGLGDPGTPANADAILQSGQENDQFGVSAACAGDVNGDGIADFVAGAPWGIVEPDPQGSGLVHVFLGSLSGVATTPSWSSADQGVGSVVGTAVASAGDLNGDGLADFASNDVESDDDVVTNRIWYGGGGRPTLRARQRRADDSAPIAPLGLSDDPHQVRLSAYARSAFGRTRAKLEWELDPLGTLFDGANTGQGDFFDTGLGGAEGAALATRLVAAPTHHWRARLRFDAARTPYAPASRWFALPLGGWNEAVLRFTAGTTAVGPRGESRASDLALRIAPHPLTEHSRLEFELPGAALVDLALYDVAGRLRARLASGVFAPGRHELRWSGRDAAGRSLVPGVYFLKLSLDGRDAGQRKVVLAR